MADLGYLLWKRGLKQDILRQLYLEDGGGEQTSNATKQFVKGFIVSQSRSIRTSMVILGSFNVLAAFAIASTILYDSYRASKRHGYKT
jgi:hypothetical protein